MSQNDLSFTQIIKASRKVIFESLCDNEKTRQ